MSNVQRKTTRFCLNRTKVNSTHHPSKEFFLWRQFLCLLLLPFLLLYLTCMLRLLFLFIVLVLVSVLVFFLIFLMNLRKGRVRKATPFS